MNRTSKLLVLLCFTAAAACAHGAPTGAAGPGASSDARAGRIGVIGAGRVGGTVAALWAKAGYSVLLASRHPEELRALASSLGPNAKVGTPRDAAEFGDVVFLAVPYGAMPQLGAELAPLLAGKVVLDAGNPIPRRDGEMANDARQKGSGVATAEFLPGARIVRAFNTVNYRLVASEAHRAGDRLAIPLAGDDPQALATAQRLVRDAGFEPVVVGPLSSSRQFDQGAPGYGPHTASDLRERLGIR